jgi:arylsulfatase A-like enzyme
MKTKHPNLIFILPDQWRATALGCYGNPDVQTPNLDRLAQESLVFDRAYTASPVCTPFRGTLFTGRYPTQTGVLKNGYRIPDEEVTLAELFAEGGYHTAYVGKWHLSGPPGGNRWVPPQERAGFETFIGWESHHVNHWEGRIWADEPDHPLPMPGHETDALTDIALDVLDGLKPPFCLFIAYQAPHPPCSPPPMFQDLYRDQPLHHRPNVDPDVWYDRPEWDADYDLRTFVERYYGEITQLDSALGRLLSRTAKSDLESDTILVFTSDHGEMMGSHGLYSKGVMYEESTQIPLIVHYPEGPQGERSDALFSSVDFMPTLLSLCDLPDAPTAQGMDYAPLIRGGAQQKARDAVYMEYSDRLLCIRRMNVKLIAQRETLNPIALYDLETDPFEETNHLNDVKYDEQQTNLQQALRHWYQDILERRGSRHKSAAESSPFFREQ